MGTRAPEITDELRAFLEAQAVFFVATAPLAADGHVNVSPKGLDTLRILEPTRIAYLDFTGSGNETAAHITQNGRLTVMCCAFSGRPRIVRLYCRGRAVTPGDAEWSGLRARFGDAPGVRQIVVGEVEFVQTSCGYGVPLMELAGPRDTLPRWAEAKGEAVLAEYRAKHNRTSLDGIDAPPLDERR